MLEPDRNKFWSQKRLLLIIPCLLSVICMSVYILGIWPIFNLTLVNVLCLPLFFAELALGLLEKDNKEKSILFFAAIFIGTAATGLNLWTDLQTLNAIVLSGLSGWSLIWVILLLLAVISFLTVLIRQFRWSQEQWEAAQKLRQEHRLAKKNSRSNYILTKLENKNAYRSQMQTNRQDSKIAVKGLKQKVKKQIWEAKVEVTKVRPSSQDKSSRSPNEAASFTARYIGVWEKIGAGVMIVFVLLAIAGFFVVPFWTSLVTATSNWSQAVTNLVQFLKSEKPDTPEQAFLQYVFFYFLAVVIIGTILFLTWQFIKQSLNIKSNTEFSFFTTYQTPVSVLLVCSAFLYAFTNGKADFPNVTKTWEFLLLVILIILVLLTAIELVRIVLDQCARKNSFLKRLIYYVFVAISKFLSDFLIGVITNFRIHMAVSSLFSLMFPITTAEEEAFTKQLNQKLTCLFHEALSKKPDEDSTLPIAPTQRTFRRQRIWRRHKP